LAICLTADRSPSVKQHLPGNYEGGDGNDFTLTVIP